MNTQKPSREEAVALNQQTSFGLLDGSKISVSVEWILPELAELYLGANRNNRNQRDRVIKAYARDLQGGAWGFTGDPIRFDWNGRLIDGQHRLEACVSSGKGVLTLVVRGLDPEVQKLIDTNARRTASDALKFAGVAAQQKDIAAVARISASYERGELKTALDNIRVQLTNSEVIRWYEENPDVEQALSLASRTTRGTGVPVAALGFALLTLLRIDSDAAVEFVTSTAEYRTDGSGDPRKALLDAVASIRKSRAPRPAESLSIIFRAWNKWRADEEVKLIRVTAGGKDGEIVGVGIVTPI